MLSVTGGGSTGRGGRLDEVDLGGRLVTPAFVDAHVHLAATGLAEQGADLSQAGSVDEALAVVLPADADPRFTRVVRASSLLVDGVSTAGPALRQPLHGPTQVEVLPPFAGG